MAFAANMWGQHHPDMEHRIDHACGHQQVHYLTGYASQRDRKAAWLRTTKCRTCFVADKQNEATEAAARDLAALEGIALPTLCGSDRQVDWASTIRASRLAGMRTSMGDGDHLHACLTMTDAKWWIDHRSLTDAELVAKARAAVGLGMSEDRIQGSSIARAA